MTKRNSQRLIKAVRSADLDEVREMILIGADVNAADALGYTPLHWCSQIGDCDIAIELLRHGAACDQPDKDGFTPIRVALAHRNEDLAFMLLDHNADIAQSLLGSTLLHVASASGSSRFVTHMLTTDVDRRFIDQRDKEGTGRTALHWSLQEKHHDIVRSLIAAGANVNIADSDGFTPLCVSAGEGDLMGIELLINAGAELNPTDSTSTPLELAVAWEFKDVVEYLLKAGANVNLSNAEGVRPLQFAVDSGNKKIIEMLKADGAT